MMYNPEQGNPQVSILWIQASGLGFEDVQGLGQVSGEKQTPRRPSDHLETYCASTPTLVRFWDN